MRKVLLSMITPEMKLAKSTYHENSMLLVAGTNRLNRFIPWLASYGITALYVEDEVSEGIEIPDAITEETRCKCKTALQGVLQSVQADGSFSTGAISGVVDSLLEDILNRPDVLISLNDIGTTDDMTLVHSVNTTVFALLLGQRMDLSVPMLQKLAEGTLLHDIGKTILDSKILYKPGRLNAEEFEHVKRHTTLGYEILKCNPLMTELPRLVCLQHHERLDGSGYPNALHSEEIHVFSKIAAIADMYDAITSERCYHHAISNRSAVNILMRDSVTKIDPELLALFIQNIAIYPNGTIVYLSDGTHGIVKAQNQSMPHRPVVRVIDDREGIGNVKKLHDVDLMETLNLTITDEDEP
ncbi:MAG: HD-GYP domain-containing protein [Lachnospiraceae bacterium]